MKFLTINNVAFIAVVTVIVHALARPIYNMIDGGNSNSGN